MVVCSFSLLALVDVNHDVGLVLELWDGGMGDLEWDLRVLGHNDSE